MPNFAVLFFQNDIIIWNVATNILVIITTVNSADWRPYVVASFCDLPVARAKVSRFFIYIAPFNI